MMFNLRLNLVDLIGLDLAKEIAIWGTYGLGGWRHCHGRCEKHQIRYRKLKDLTTQHLFNILGADGELYHLTPDYRMMIDAILHDRGLDNIVFLQ